MLPTLLPFTHKHPRYVALMGICFFIGVAFLWYLSVQTTTVPTVVETKEQIFDPQTLLISPDVSNPEAVEKYVALVEVYAVESDSITIHEKCAMEPLIIKMKENSTLKIENEDAVEHTIAFEDQNFFNVSSAQVREVNISEVFGKGEGVYRYRCNDLSLQDNVGVMYVVK